MGIFKLKLFLFCPLLLVRQRSFTFAAYQQRLLLVEAGHTNEGAAAYENRFGKRESVPNNATPLDN